MKSSSNSNVITTPAKGLREGAFKLPVEGGTIDAYFAAPDVTGRLPIVLVVQEIFGVHEHIRDVCRRFAHAGYLAISPELYQRQGDASKYDDIPQLISELVGKVPDEQVMADLDACLVWAGLHGGNLSQVAVTGFCWGGRIVWMYAAHQPKVKAGVAWYGKLASGHGPLIKQNPIDIAAQVHAPILGLYGAQDTSIPLDTVQQMRDALSHGNINAQASQIHVYPEAGHAFYADYRPSYIKEVADDAWKRCLAWIARNLGS